METEKNMICAQCGFVGQKERFSRGNWVLEIFLWLMLFVPGTLYTTWRALNEYHACPICKNEDMTPLNSALGQKIATERERLGKPISKNEFAQIVSKLIR